MKGVFMVENVNISSIESAQQIEQKKEYNHNQNFRANDFERTPQEDNVEISDKKRNITKAAISVGVVGALVTLGILGRKGKLGPSVQKFLGGANKEEEQVKESLEKLLENHKNKKLSELTNEEKNKIIEALNPENKNEIKTQIETEFEAMKDKNVSEVVDSVKKKLNGVSDEAKGSGKDSTVVKPEKPDEKATITPSGDSSSSTVEKDSHKSSPSRPKDTPESKNPGSPSKTPSPSSSERTSSPEKSKTTSGGKKAQKAADEITPDKPQKGIPEEKKASDTLDETLDETELSSDKKDIAILSFIAKQMAITTNFCNKDSKEITEKFISRIREYFKTVDFAEMNEDTQIRAFLLSVCSGMKEAEVNALIKEFGLDKILTKTDEILTHNGKKVKAILKGKDSYILSDGSVLTKEGENLELESIEDTFKLLEELMKDMQAQQKGRKK